MLRLFVYGTLKPDESAYPHYCEPYVTATQTACVRGELFHLPQGYPALTRGDRWITGALLVFRQEDAIARVDDFEDYDPTRPAAANLYERVVQPVFSTTQQPLGDAWVYLMSAQRVQTLGGSRVESGVWSQTAFEANQPF